QTTLARMDLLLAAFFASAIGLGLILGWRSSRAVTRPLAALGHAAHAIGEGDLTSPIAVAGAQEFMDLAADLEWMRRQLRHYTDLAAAREAALAETEATLRGVYQAMDCGIMVSDPAGTVIGANDGALSLLGLDRDTLLGHTIGEATGAATSEAGTPIPIEQRPTARALAT